MNNVTAAVRDAIATATNQPSTVPELPPHWLPNASAALEQNDPISIMDAAVELVEAHTGYRAAWDHWPWLETLRDVTLKERVLRNAKRILGYGETERALSYYCRFANSTMETAKAVLDVN